MNKASTHSQSIEDLPTAKMERNWKTRLFWLVPIAAAALAGWFIYSQVFRHGPTLHLYFADAQGLEPGKSEVKYRGAQIGTIKEVKLTQDHQQVEITVELNHSAESVAREGSRFWIVRAQLGLEQVRALRTIVSGDYITVEPGEGRPQTKFVGLAEAPVEEAKAGVRVLLLAEKMGAVKKRSPVFYRGIQVGEVFDCRLGPTSQAIHILVDIEKPYTDLLRMNSKFWKSGGIHVSLGLSGADISAQSAEALVSGGVSFATPNTNEKPATAGTAFRLYDKPEDQWLDWAPRIDLAPAHSTSSPEFSKTSQTSK